MTKRSPDWIDENEYPDDRDVEQFGDDAPYDDDPLTIGKVRTRKRATYSQPSYWTPQRIITALIALALLLTFLMAELAPLFNR